MFTPMEAAAAAAPSAAAPGALVTATRGICLLSAVSRIALADWLSRSRIESHKRRCPGWKLPRRNRSLFCSDDCPRPVLLFRTRSSSTTVLKSCLVDGACRPGALLFMETRAPEESQVFSLAQDDYLVYKRLSRPIMTRATGMTEKATTAK